MEKWLTMLKLGSFLIALSLCIASEGYGGDVNGQFAVDGVGARSCKDFTDALANKEDPKLAAAFASWTNGFMSASNAFGNETFDLTPWQTVEVVLAKMRTYCNQYPDEAYVQALGTLISVLRAQRLAEQNEIVRFAWQEKAVFIYRDVLKQIRDKLEKLGYPIDAEEGAYEDEFVQALLKYQGDSGLPKTGLPDQPTLVRMLDR